jgi:hypothetical protein
MNGNYPSLPLGVCPGCGVEVYPEDVRLTYFNCPICSAALEPVRNRLHGMLIMIFSYGAGFLRAWTRWHDSFVIFLVGFCAIPFLFLAIDFHRRFFPAHNFERQSSFLALNIMDLTRKW